MQNALKLSPSFAGADDARLFVELATLADDRIASTASAERVQQVLQESPDYAPALMIRASLAQQQNDVKTARQSAEKVLNQFPLFSPAQRSLGVLYLTAPADYQKAFDHGLKAREAYPNDVEVAKALGMASYHRADYRRAIELLTEAARQRIDDPEVLACLGLAQHQLKRSDDARPNLEKAVALDPNSPLAAEAKKVLAQLSKSK
jgi:tetratricopeptide (TPR) repeat protein